MRIPSLRRFLPFLNWPRPTLVTLRKDAWAGISVGLVLIPQAIAYATLAGMPPQTGLYAALLPSIIGALWGSSALLVIGPVALTGLLVFGSLSALAEPGTAHWVALAIWLAIYSGVIQLVLGLFKLGGISSLVSQPVTVGFINAAGIIIILSQLPAMIGATGADARDISGLLSHIQQRPTEVFLNGLFGIGALCLLVGFKRIFPRFPGILVVAVLGIGVSWLIDYASHGGAIVGYIPAGLPPIAAIPEISADQHRILLPAALVIALISFTEVMSSSRVLARKRQELWDENQELVGQGLAKLASGLCGAFPVSGSFSRSALNLYAGAATAWSSLFSSACVLLCLLFLTEALHYLPRSLLAAMIMVPVLNLLDFSAFRRFFLISRDDGVVALVTFAVTLLAIPALHWGVFAGIALTMISYLYRRTHPRIIEVSIHPDGTLRDRARFELEPLAPDVLAVRMDEALNFLTGATLERFVLEQCVGNKRIHRVLLCASPLNDIDASGIVAIESLQQTLKDRGIDLYFSAIKKQVWDVLVNAGTIHAIQNKHVFSTDSEAVAVLRQVADGAAQRK
jgi:sulfate permease, SulP family